ncbi:Histone transcription regulator 3 [Podila humilis]|nr:Histone transcription regulator 3 [Podila humilis]
MVIRFAVLNEEEQTKTREEESVEIQAEKCLGVYQSAIRFLQKGNLSEARRLLQNLIDSDLLQNIDNKSELAARGTPLRLLQYLVYTNYASILEQSPDEAAGVALQCYLKAMAFDNSDSSLWIKIGTLAAKEKRWRLARYSLECGLVAPRPEDTDQTPQRGSYFYNPEDEDLTPTQWSCLETLCEVLFEIGDYEACQDHVGKALRISPYFQRGLDLQQKMKDRSEAKHWKDILHMATLPVQSLAQDQVVQQLALEEPDWTSLGELLLEEYKNNRARSTDTSFYNRRLVVRIQNEPAIISQDVEMIDSAISDPANVALENVGVSTELNQSTEETRESAPGAGDSSETAHMDETLETNDKDCPDGEQNAALKRKRKDVEERPGLRTSKRVRDKLDQFEVTKKKRQEEEQEILAKYQIVLSKFGMDLDNAYIGLKTNHFAIFTLDKSDATIDDFFKSRSSLEIFVNNANRENSGLTEYMCAYIMAVMSSDPDQSGTISLWQRKWPEGLRPIVSDIINEIEEHLIEYLHDEHTSDMSTEIMGQRNKLEVQMAIVEMYLDEMIAHSLQSSGSSSRRGRVLKKLDAEQTAAIEKKYQKWLFLTGFSESPMDKEESWVRSIVLRREWALGRHDQCLGNAAEAITHFGFCLSLFNTDSTLTVHLPNCKYDTTIDEATVQERRRKLHTHQYVLDAERLFRENEYKDVMTRLEPIFLSSEGASPPSALSATDDLQSFTSNSIGGALSERLELMGLLYKSCEALGDRSKQFRCVCEMFTNVVESLVNSATDKTEASDIWFLFIQTSHLLLLLRETLQAAALSELLGSIEPRQLQKVVCCVLALARLGFVNILHQDRLVDDDIKISYSDLLKNRPHLQQFNLLLIRAWLVLLLILPGWFQEQEDAQNPYYSDVSMISSHAHPLKKTPLDMKSMELDMDTVQRIIAKPLTSNSSTPLGLYTTPSQELYMELIALIHDDLGIRELCGIDNGQLIQLALKVSSPMQGPFYRKEENQCYYCFYGISLSVDGQYPIEHSSEPVDFDRQAATEFFPLLERSLSDRALRGHVRSDIKDAVDRVEEALGQPPYESNAILALNQQLIDSYLASDINFADAVQVTSSRKLPTMILPPSSKLPSVYRKIYAIQGKIFLAQFKNKAKNNQFKPLEDLQHAIDQFRVDIHVNPDSWDSWYALATCYAYLADENLVFSASDIKNSYSKIKDLHKRSFLCFSQAVRLAPQRVKQELNVEEKAEHPNASLKTKSTLPEIPSDTIVDLDGYESEDVDDDASTSSVGSKSGIQMNQVQEWHQKQAAFWFDFGNLVYGIMSKPVRMEAMRRTHGIETMTETGDFQMVQIPEPTEEQVYKFAAFCFSRSLKLNAHNWRTFYMLGKCIEKLDGKPHQVLSLYQTAADLVPSRTGQPGNERIFEPAYKLISTLTKFLDSDKITPMRVEAVMKRSLAKSKLIVVEGESFIFEPPTEFLQPTQSDPPTEQDLKYKEKLYAFRLLCEERAKTEMLSLFQVKSNLKSLVSSVWKPEFERSGKHFVYVGEYTRLLILLAKETKDVETLNSLARKIRRANGLLLDLKEIWELLYESYLEVLADLVGPDPPLAVAEVMPRTEFREKASLYETKMFELDPKPAGLVVLQRLSELKKLNDKLAFEGQIGHLLAVCYSKLFLEVGGTDLYPKELVRQLSEEVISDKTTVEASVHHDQDLVLVSVSDTAQQLEPVQGQVTMQSEDISIKMAKLTTASCPAPTEIPREAGEEVPEINSIGPNLATSPVNEPVSSSQSSSFSYHGSAVEMDPSMEDWKSRKKISEAELASRATTVCKLPPPSLKAPQTIQNRLAGPSGAAASEDTATSAPLVSADHNLPSSGGTKRKSSEDEQSLVAPKVSGKGSELREHDADGVVATVAGLGGVRVPAETKDSEHEPCTPPLVDSSRRDSLVDTEML